MPAEGRENVQAYGIDSTLTIVTLNGEPRTVEAGCTVAALLATLGLETRKIAVERNEAIVPRSLYATTRLQPGDSLEIVHFIGGG
jgi:thiamine biosynthesis protein ThiS